jgi:hypothetical protein
LACHDDPPGYDAPAAALFDPVADVCLVANVNGQPAAKDGNGYIARVRADGSMQRRWIAGGENGVTLHAPKGMAFVGDLLWVADIDTLRVFDRASGAPRGEVPIPGATFLSGVSAAPDGTLYCTDSGLDASLAPSGTDAVWRLPGDRFPLGEPPVALVRGAELGQPNGIFAREASVYVVSWRDGRFFAVDHKGRRSDLATAPAAQLDGLVRVEAADGKAAFYATSWAGKCIYRFDAGGGCVALPGTYEQPADLGYDQRRGQLLVPLFGSDRVERVAP